MNVVSENSNPMGNKPRTNVYSEQELMTRCVVPARIKVGFATRRWLPVCKPNAQYTTLSPRHNQTE